MPRHRINYNNANILIETLIWLDASKEWDNFIILIQLTSVCKQLYALRHKITMPTTLIHKNYSYSLRRNWMSTQFST